MSKEIACFKLSKGMLINRLQAAALTTNLTISSISVFNPSLGALTIWQSGEESYPISSKRKPMSW